MSECVIPDLIALRKLAFYDICLLIGLATNHKKCGWSVLLLQDVENLGRPLGVWSVIKGESHLMVGGSHLLNSPGHGIGLKAFVVKYVALRVVVERPLPALWSGRHAPDVTVAFKDEVVARRDILQFISNIVGGICGIPDVPHGGVFHPAAP